MGTQDRDQRAAENAAGPSAGRCSRAIPTARTQRRRSASSRNAASVLADHEFCDRQVLPHLDESGRRRSAAAATPRELSRHRRRGRRARPLRQVLPQARRPHAVGARLRVADLAEYPKNPDAAEAESELDRLKAKKISVPDPPLPALVETLGRPSMAVAPQPSEVPAQTAATVPSAPQRRRTAPLAIDRFRW